MLLEIHAQATAHSYSTGEFGKWWDSLEEAGLRAFSSELNYPAIHCEPTDGYSSCPGRKVDADTFRYLAL